MKNACSGDRPGGREAARGADITDPAGLSHISRKRGETMATYTAVFAESEGWIIGWVLELRGANVQERTLEEARASMREVIPLILEANKELDRDVREIFRETIEV
jgi:predicted RNase H-like HicB family nuclease